MKLEAVWVCRKQRGCLVVRDGMLSFELGDLMVALHDWTLLLEVALDAALHSHCPEVLRMLSCLWSIAEVVEGFGAREAAGLASAGVPRMERVKSLWRREMLEILGLSHDRGTPHR